MVLNSIDKMPIQHKWNIAQFEWFNIYNMTKIQIPFKT